MVSAENGNRNKTCTLNNLIGNWEGRSEKSVLCCKEMF